MTDKRNDSNRHLYILTVQKLHFRLEAKEVHGLQNRVIFLLSFYIKTSL